MATINAIISPTRYTLIKTKDNTKGMTLIGIKFRDELDVWGNGVIAIKDNDSKEFFKKIKNLVISNSSKIEAAKQINDGSMDTLVLNNIEVVLNSVDYSTKDFEEPTIFINPRMQTPERNLLTTKDVLIAPKSASYKINMWTNNALCTMFEIFFTYFNGRSWKHELGLIDVSENKQTEFVNELFALIEANKTLTSTANKLGDDVSWTEVVEGHTIRASLEKTKFIDVFGKTETRFLIKPSANYVREDRVLDVLVTGAINIDLAGRFLHRTHFENFESILKHGLLSKSELNQRRIEHKPASEVSRKTWGWQNNVSDKPGSYKETMYNYVRFGDLHSKTLKEWIDEDLDQLMFPFFVTFKKEKISNNDIIYDRWKGELQSKFSVKVQDNNIVEAIIFLCKDDPSVHARRHLKNLESWSAKFNVPIIITKHINMQRIFKEAEEIDKSKSYTWSWLEGVVIDRSVDKAWVLDLS